MKIQVKRSGGFAGLNDTVCDLDTANLAAADAAAVESVGRNLEATLQVQGDKQPIGADLVKYEVVVSNGQGPRTLVIADDGSKAMEPFHRMLDQLSTIAGSKPR